MSRLFATADMRTLRSDVPLDEVPHQHDVLIGGQLDRQADRNILGKLRIRPFLERLDLVPKSLRSFSSTPTADHLLQPFRRIGRDGELFVQ